MRVLFVCTANQHRSKTAEVFYSQYRPWHEYKSCGTNKYLCERSGGQRITRNLLNWADIIVCMDKEHHDFIRSKIGIQFDNKIKTMAFKDIYRYMDMGLIELLKKQISFL